MKANVQLWGGPIDGFEGHRPIEDIPGKLPLLVHNGSGGRRYVYQARRFAGDGDEENAVLDMDFVQVLGPGEEI